jgi:Nuclease-related domain/AAA domain/UvrD-like helicase C-terminal domain
MAILIPSLGYARFDSRGELRLAERLKDFLEENAVVWHNLPVGPRRRHPDFIIIHPANGLLVLEVKDWRLETIVSADKNQVELLTTRGPVREINPLEQARKYAFEVVRTLERDGQLLFPTGHRFMGRPIMPYGYGAVFTNITRKQFEQAELHEVFAESLCVFKDEMTEGTPAEEFRSRVWRMVSPLAGEPLSMPQFDRLRALLFPEIRIRQIALPLDEPKAADPSDRTLEVMDMHQEQIARSLGEGHRIIRGVAGSGKTLILAFRAEHLARSATKPVLILCYANGIAGRLEDAMQNRGVEHRVQVLTFHGWCYRMLRTFGIPVPSERDYPDYTTRLAASVAEVVKAVDQGHIPAEQYDAVFIDEAHDFEPQWLALAAKMVNPRTKALMVVYDDIQAIYKGRERPVWKQLGIEATGRTTILKVNYRNTSQIITFAKRFAADVIGAPGTTAGDEQAVLLPEDAGRQGLEPDVRKCISIEAEAHCVAEWLLGRMKAGYEWPQMACLYPEHWIGEKVAQILGRHDVPIDMVKNNKNRISMKKAAVRLLSMHTAKGLEFPCVAIAGLGFLGRRGEPIEECVRLTYVGVTRATHEALLTYSSESALVQRLIA